MFLSLSTSLRTREIYFTSLKKGTEDHLAEMYQDSFYTIA